MVYGSGFRVSGFRIQSPGLRDQGLEFRVDFIVTTSERKGKQLLKNQMFWPEKPMPSSWHDCLTRTIFARHCRGGILRVSRQKGHLTPFRKVRRHSVRYTVQGYLAHKKSHLLGPCRRPMPTVLRGVPYAYGPREVLGGWTFSYGRGTPVG